MGGGGTSFWYRLCFFFFFFLLNQTIPPLCMVVWSAALLVSLTSVNSNLTPMLCEKVIPARGPASSPPFQSCPVLLKGEVW